MLHPATLSRILPAVALLLAVPAAADEGPWIFAREDTARIPAFFEMSEIEITADRLGIGEIVERCIRREEELRELIETHEYTLSARLVLSIGGEGDNARRRLVSERLERRLFRKPGENHKIPLAAHRYQIEDGERKPWDPDEDEDIGLDYDELSEMPFYLKDRADYRFRIVSREIVGKSVIYEVGLTPRSDFEIAPSGRIWVDTSTFSILREEFDFEDRVPLPLLVKRVGPVVRERERVGDFWVWKRIAARIEIRGKLLRWLDGDVPDVAQWVVHLSDHRVNRGWSTDEERE